MSSGFISDPSLARDPGQTADDTIAGLLAGVAQGVANNGETLSISLDLLRRIIELLLPKAAGDGPTLTELLAAILATQRETLTVIRSTAENTEDILRRLDSAGMTIPHGSLQPDGSRHA